MKLYHHPISGHAHRARLFLGLLGLEHELVEVDLANGAHKSPEFVKLNPLGQVPVLQDGDTVILILAQARRNNKIAFRITPFRPPSSRFRTAGPTGVVAGPARWARRLRAYR